MSASLIPNIKFRWFDNNGNPLSGGLVYSYISGTSTPANTYSDEPGTTANTNPVVLDSAGYAAIYLDDSISYRIVVKSSTGVTIQDVSNVTGTSPTVSASTVSDETVTATQGQTLIPITLSYIPGSGALQVSLNGAVQVLDIDYSETTANSITFATGLNAGDVVYFRIFTTAVFTAPNAAAVPYAGPSGSTFVANALDDLYEDHYTHSGTGAVEHTRASKLNQTISVLDFLTDAEQAACLAYTYVTDVTAGFQAAMNAAYAQRAALYVPNGGYLVTSLTVPGLGADYSAFQMYGDGIGNPFAVVQGNVESGSIIRSKTSGTMFSWNTELVVPADMQFLIRDIGFWGTSGSGVPLVYFEGYYGMSVMSRCLFYQEGVGDGLVIGYGAGMYLEMNYIYNKDLFATTYPLGTTARVGKGVWIKNTYGGGLNTLHKNSSRGWEYGYYVGETAVSATNFKTTFTQNEGSTVKNGIWFERGCDGCTIAENYFEGLDAGTAIHDNGRQTTITGNFIFPGATIGIHSMPDTLGAYIAYNYVALKPTGASTGILMDMSGATYAGLARTCSNNNIIYGGTVGPAIGIQVLGASPFLDLSSNMMNPNIVWAGAGSKAIDDQSTGNGITGYSEARIGSLRFPKVARGSYSVGLDTTVLTQTNVDGSNVLTVTDASDFVMTATVATNVTSITGPNLPGKLFWLRTTNANTTFTPSATLKLSGSVAYTPGANGASLCFKVQSGVAWEVHRTAY